MRARRGALVAFATIAAAAFACGSAPAAVLRGVDLSHYNGTVNWAQLDTGGVSFVFQKATEGLTLTDPTYPINRQGAAVVGLPFGAYHFARPAGSGAAAITANAVAQADRLVSFAQPAAGDLAPVLDLEQTGGLTPAQLVLWTQQWLDEAQARVGVAPIVYAGLNFWQTALGDTTVFATGGYKLWFARYTTAASTVAPAANWGGLGWTFWQWTDCLHVPGISRCVDGDRYRGGDLSPVTIPAGPTAAPTASSPPTVVGTPQVGKLLAATVGAWGGGGPTAFSYQWQRCPPGGGCAAIQAATRETYTPVAADAGQALVVAVTAQNALGSATVASAQTAPVTAGAGTPAGPSSVSPPAIAGTPQAGQELRASAGTWRGSPTSFAYQWRRCDAGGGACKAIARATVATYTPLAPDIGATLRVVVTAKNRSGSKAASAAATAPVAPAPVPPPAAGSAVAVANQAGAVTTADGGVVVSWQPGAVVPQTTVALGPAPLSARRLAVAGSAAVLTLAPPTPGTAPAAAWPLDLAFAADPAGLVPGLAPGSSWHAVPALAAPVLAAGASDGAYVDSGGRLHVLTLTPGVVGLFHAGRWGDPRYATAGPPRPTRTGARARLLAGRAVAGGVLLFSARLAIDGQAHLWLSVLGRGSSRLVLLPGQSRLGTRLSGPPSRTIQTLVLRPGARPLVLAVRVPPGGGAGAPRLLRVVALDPYGRRGVLLVPLAGRRTG